MCDLEVSVLRQQGVQSMLGKTGGYNLESWSHSLPQA